MNIKVFVKENCPWCVDLENFLKFKKIDYSRFEVLSNKDFFDEMIKLSGQSKAPTVVFDDKEIYGDTDKEQIERILIQKNIL